MNKGTLKRRREEYYEIECLDQRTGHWFLFDRWQSLEMAEWSAAEFASARQIVRLYGPRRDGRPLIKEMGR